jgi:glycosyltransferase involved in cell wall biosynthesis
VKILSVIEAFGHGGAQTVLLDVVLSLREHEHRVVHFSHANGIAAEATFVEKLRAAGIECVDTHWDSLREEAPRARLLADFRPDVVMFHWWGKDPWMPWVMARRARAPIFMCVMHHAVFPARAGYDRYVVVSRNQLPQVAHIEPDRVEMIPNGIDLARFPLRTNRRDDSIDAQRHFVIGRLSEMREGKIPSDWIRTIAQYRLENTRFVIAGDGALLPPLREMASALNLDEQVSFPGYIARDKVPALLASFDVFCYVTSSALECCPLAILEAMASGLPIVAEARGGIPEIVVDGVNGLLAHSMEEIGNHLRRLRDDRVLRERLGRGARATAERFSLENQLGSYRELLATVQERCAAGGYTTLSAPMEKLQ